MTRMTTVCDSNLIRPVQKINSKTEVGDVTTQVSGLFAAHQHADGKLGLKTKIHRLMMGLALVLLLGCFVENSNSVFSAAAPPPKLGSVKIGDVPHVRQKPDFCGEACVAMYLKKLGSPADQDFVFDRSGLNPLLGRGCYTKELAQALKTIGFDIGPVFKTVPAAEKSRELSAEFSALHQDLLDGVPSIICMHYDDQPKTTEHFRLILGYDAKSDEVLYHEPAEADGAYRRMARELLLRLWPLKYERNRWTLIRFRLKPRKLVTGLTAKTNTDADYAQHILKLKSKLPGNDFTIVIQRPFVVIGDEPEKTVQKRASQTIKWAVDYLKQDYFERDPEQILDIWLFKDEESYNTNAKTLFGQRPSTPFGYYSPTHQALVMNISTGGGTLVHEIVHPFMASNFEECPSWFNEGLASLYEQCGESDGHIRGETNWRLKGLQEAIKKDRLPTFETLCGTTRQEFYDDIHGTNYPQARYLCYYLQERHLLRKYYQEFRRNAKTDPSGYKTLQTLLGEDDMSAFQKRWQDYVGKLKFP